MGGRGGGTTQGVLWRPLWENPKGQKSGEGGMGDRGQQGGREGPAPARAQGSGRRDEQEVLSVNNQNHHQHNKVESLSFERIPPAFDTRSPTYGLLGLRRNDPLCGVQREK